MNKYAREIQAIREARAGAAVLNCMTIPAASMVQGVGRRSDRLASFIPESSWSSRSVRAGDLKRAQAARRASTAEDVVYGMGARRATRTEHEARDGDGRRSLRAVRPRRRPDARRARRSRRAEARPCARISGGGVS